MSNGELKYQGKKVLVTGGLGFIGSNIVHRLVSNGAMVTILDSGLPDCGANLFNVASVASQVELVEADIGSAENLAEVLRGTDVVLNLAGEISHSRSMTDPERDLHLNTVCQLRFLLACRSHCPSARIVYAGTRQVYGKPNSLPVNEDHPIQPVDFNGVHKYAAAQYHMLLARRGDLDCVVLRLSNVYGPRMALRLPQQGFLGVYLRRALGKESIEIYGDGTQLRDPVHVEDVVDAFLAAGVAGQLSSRVFNVGGPRARTLREIADALAAESGGQSQVKQVPFPASLQRIDIGSYCTDNSRMIRQLGISPNIEFEDGVRQTLAYYREHQRHYLDPGDMVTSVMTRELSLAPTA